MNEEERTSFLQTNLTRNQFKDWKNLTSSSEISNSLWHALDNIKQEEQRSLKKQEKELQDKEIELQRQLKSAEAGVKQQLAQRKLTACFSPIANAIARLRFSNEQIDEFSASGKTIKMLRKTFTSWQGLTALFTMTLLIVLTLDPESRTSISTTTQILLEQTGLKIVFNRYIPAGVKDSFTSFNRTILTWFRNLPEWLKAIQTKIPTGIQVLTAIIASTTALLPIMKALGAYVTSVQKEQAQIQSERDILLKQEKSKAEALVKEMAQLKLHVDEQRQRVGLTANYASLIDFVSDRLKADEYGKRLGLMQQVKQDIAALSNRLTDQTHNREELKKFLPRGPARVILYIDDLDRCPPNRVVEVLEAVQLLLNTKLFVVVLGIDDRYIARSLEQVYKGVLKRGGRPSGMDYLEKIIQIPYRMRPISPSTVDSYLRSQLNIRSIASSIDSQVSQSPIPTHNLASRKPLGTSSNENSKSPELTDSVTYQTHTSESSDAIVLSTNQVPTTKQSIDQSVAESPSEEHVNQQKDVITISEQHTVIETTKSLTAQTNLPLTISHKTAAPSDSDRYLETVAAITEFDETEFQMIVNCCKHVDITPRAAKRLINVYKILQIIWSNQSQGVTSPSSPLDEPDKRVIMSFLALSGRYPSYIRILFEEINFQFEEKMLGESNKEIADNPQLDIELDKLLHEPRLQPTFRDRHAYQEWRKFTIDIERIIQNPKNSRNKPIKFILNRRNFDLLLSFCFIGDIGYDPDDYQVDTKSQKITGIDN